MKRCARSRTSPDSVAEKSAVWRFAGQSRSSLRTSGAKPMSRSRSASSSTTTRMPSSEQRPAIDVIEHAARCPDHDRHPALQRSLLRTVGNAAVDRHLVGVAELSQRAEFTRDLDGELAGRHDDEGLGPLFGRVDALDDRYGECRRLAGAGLRLSEQVAPRAQHRDGLLLHRGRRHETKLIDGARDVGMDLQRAEATGCDLCHTLGRRWRKSSVILIRIKYRRATSRLCSACARIVPCRAHSRHRHPRAHLVAAHLLPGAAVPRGPGIPGHISAVVPAEDLHRVRHRGVPVLHGGTAARAGTRHRRAPLQDVGLVDHAVPARRRREPHQGAAERESGVLHGGSRAGSELRDRRAVDAHCDLRGRQHGPPPGARAGRGCCGLSRSDQLLRRAVQPVAGLPSGWGARAPVRDLGPAARPGRRDANRRERRPARRGPDGLVRGIARLRRRADRRPVARTHRVLPVQRGVASRCSKSASRPRSEAFASVS